ncbi:tetratricopeptide repeat-containing sulfotransferase family protein [Croceicoccus sediminis]|uniref:tetratricopeptide repeat-containing sulfotransferase family protein n=1 Tax=Croceicoccus sediminis TaxID=2571150 RepID=UPI0011830A6F|nr:sulfotransferase [Croceicoccus sediminis]
MSSAQQALRDHGADAAMVLVLAAIALEHDNDGKAQELAELAQRIGGAAGWCEIVLGRLALKRSDTVAARAAARAAAKAGVPWARLAGDLGVLFSRTGLHLEALPYLERAAEADPGDAQAAYNHAIALQFAGRLDAARARFEQAVAADPNHASAWLALVALAPDRHGDMLPVLSAAFAEKHISAEDRLVLGHALARILEDAGEWDKSLAILDDAKAPMREKVDHDRAQTEKLFAAAAACAAVKLPGGVEGDTAPIFVVGMPRTGTTLVERILSAHPDVRSAGELSDFAVLVKRSVRTPGKHVLDPETLFAARDADLGDIGPDYVARVRSIVGDTPHFIDKMPFNFFFAPLILRALPGARIVCLRRSAFDTLFSNYRQLFATAFTYYSYAYGFNDTAHFVAQFEKLIDRFESDFPADRFLTVRYEDIVGDFDNQARKLVHFAGLDWDPACAAFHENAAPVATASSLQVRSPIYKSSLKRWARYPEGAKRAIARFAEFGISEEADR